jgi:ferredoxin
MSKNIIFYFSGTGNSFNTAREIASALGDTELVFTKGDYKPTDSYERIGFVFPCYAGGAPKPMLEFLRALPLHTGSSDYVFSVVTCNVAGSNSLPMLRNELQKKGLALHYGKVLPMVGNYVIEYAPPKNQAEKLAIAQEKTTQIAEEIKNKALRSSGRKLLPFSAFYAVGNQFFKYKEKQFRVSDACIFCGLCAGLCPVGNITCAGGKPEFLHKSCTNCLACLHWCPKAAIDCGRSTVKRERYHHPDVTAAELIRGRQIIE